MPRVRKTHMPSSAIWMPLIVIAFLIFAFLALALIAHPGARLPPSLRTIPVLNYLL